MAFKANEVTKYTLKKTKSAHAKFPLRILMCPLWGHYITLNKNQKHFSLLK